MKTCRWWGAEVQSDYGRFFTDGRTCEKQFTAGSQAWMLGVDHCNDGDPQSGEVVTGPDFGCIHHEEKP